MMLNVCVCVFYNGTNTHMCVGAIVKHILKSVNYFFAEIEIILQKTKALFSWGTLLAEAWLNSLLQHMRHYQFGYGAQWCTCPSM